mgnify:CR=1 FL=1
MWIGGPIKLRIIEIISPFYNKYELNSVARKVNKRIALNLSISAHKMLGITFQQRSSFSEKLRAFSLE